VLDPSKPLLLGGSDELTIDYKGRGSVAVERIYSQDNHFNNRKA
jgi:hypothetical protein